MVRLSWIIYLHFFTDGQDDFNTLAETSDIDGGSSDVQASNLALHEDGEVSSNIGAEKNLPFQKKAAPSGAYIF